MVAVKIQSKEDIIKAYLKSFGFEKERLVIVTETILGKLQNVPIQDADKIVQFIDDILTKQAKRIFSPSPLEDNQLLAQFKLCFFKCKGAKCCSTDNLKKLQLPEDLIAKMRKSYVVNAPQYHYQAMKPQSIEQ